MVNWLKENWRQTSTSMAEALKFQNQLYSIPHLIKMKLCTQFVRHFSIIKQRKYKEHFAKTWPILYKNINITILQNNVLTHSVTILHQFSIQKMLLCTNYRAHLNRYHWIFFSVSIIQTLFKKKPLWSNYRCSKSSYCTT